MNERAHLWIKQISIDDKSPWMGCNKQAVITGNVPTFMSGTVVEKSVSLAVLIFNANY